MLWGECMGTRNDKLERLYSMYGKEKVNEEISGMDSRNKEILMMFFGLNGNKRESVDDISAKFKLSSIAIYKIINKELERIEKSFIYPNINKGAFLNAKSDFLKKLYEKYPQEQILEELNSFDEKERAVFNAYYGVNDCEIKKADEIEQIYGIKKATVSSYVRTIVKKIIANLENKNKIRVAQKNSRLDRLYKTYGESSIRLAIDDLGENAKRIMSLYLGLDGEKPKSAKEISKIVNSGENSINTIIWVSISKIEKILQSPNKREVLLEERKAKVIKNFSEKYGEEQIYESLNYLKEIDKKVFISYYGLDGKKPKSYKEVALAFHISEEESLRIIQRSIYSVRSLLDDVENKDRRLMVKYKRLLVKFTDNEIKDFTYVLKGEQRNIIQMYLGVDGPKESFESLMKLYEMNAQDLYKVINDIFAGISKTLDNMPALLGTLYFKYGKKLVDEAIARLSVEERQVIYDYRYRPKASLVENFIEQIKNLEDEIKDLQEQSMNEEEIAEKRIELLVELIMIKDKQRFKTALDSLEKEELMILIKYFPLKNKKIYSIDELAKEMKLTNSQMREKILKIVDKLNELMKMKTR